MNDILALTIILDCDLMFCGNLSLKVPSGLVESVYSQGSLGFASPSASEV